MKDLPGETWKPIPGYPGYDVSDHGRVRSYRTRAAGKGNSRGWYIANAPQRLIRQCNNDRYPFVGLVNEDGGIDTCKVHSLVMLAFVGPCPDGLEVCHNDDDNTNNCLDNLRYDTHLSNMRDASKNGRWGLSAEDVIDIRTRYAAGESTEAIAADHPVSACSIWPIVVGRNYKYIGGPITRRNAQ